MSQDHRNYFNNLAPQWDTLMPESDSLKTHLKDFNIQPGETVLDLGAGTGRMTKFLHELVKPTGHVIAQDIAEDMLFIARGKLGTNNIKYICDDTCSLSFKDNAFDKILCFSALPHFQNQQQALNEMIRILKPTGSLLILHLADSSELNEFHSSLDGIVNRDKLPDSESMNKMLKNAGAKNIQTEESPGLYRVQAFKL